MKRIFLLLCVTLSLRAPEPDQRTLQLQALDAASTRNFERIATFGCLSFCDFLYPANPHTTTLVRSGLILAVAYESYLWHRKGALERPLIDYGAAVEQPNLHETLTEFLELHRAD